MIRSPMFGLSFSLVLCGALSAQQPLPPTPMEQLSRPRTVHLGGPRMGITVLSGDAAEIAERDHGLERSVLTQFGWQFERRFFAAHEGPSGIFEWVVLVGGLDQGKVFPSVSWITGVRSQSGLELGAGPNATPIGVGFALAAGYNVRSGYMNFPLNIALVSSEKGIRTSALIGFTTRR